MGWSSYHYDEPLKTAAQKKEAMRKQFGNDPNWGTILKDAFVGKTYYAAVKHKKTGDVFALVVLVQVDNDEWDNLSYKSMSEGSGPLQTDCPVGILNLLSPTDDKDALKWREQCRANAKRRSISLKNGDIIEFEKPIHFYPSDTECRKFEVCKYPRRHTYFLMLEGDGSYCRIDGWKKLNFKKVAS